MYLSRCALSLTDTDRNSTYQKHQEEETDKKAFGVLHSAETKKIEKTRV